MNHTPKCLAYQTERKQALADFEAKYPHYCHQCEGTGVMTVRDSVPYGSTWVSMYSEEPCEACEGAEIPRCAVCGTEMVEDEAYVLMRACGCSRDICAPYPFEDCECGLEDLEDQEFLNDPKDESSYDAFEAQVETAASEAYSDFLYDMARENRMFR